MKSRYLYLIIIIVVAALVYQGFQNKQDPLWDEIGEKIESEFNTLDKSAARLQTIYNSINHSSQFQVSAIDLLSDPFLPIMEIEKLEKYFDYVGSNKFTIFSGVTGAGSTTLIETIAKLIAPKDDHRIEIICAPQFDLSLHAEYIGEEKNGRFQQGKLLKFWEECLSNPNENFVLIIDDFDKINPETFFGPLLWRKLGSRDFQVTKGGSKIVIPDNFYMLISIHSGEGSRVELNNEHFKRLGGKVFIAPEVNELILYLQNKKEELQNEIKNLDSNLQRYNDLSEDLAILEDPNQLKQQVYFFDKVNQWIEEKFTREFQLGQWNNIRKLYRPSDIQKMSDVFINHVNSLSSEYDISVDDLAPVMYTIDTNGKMMGSNPISSFIKYLEDKGFLTEFIAGLIFMIFTALVSFILFRRKLRYINSYTEKVYELTNKFDSGELSYESISQQFVEIKKEVDQLVLSREISYTEAVFFYNFIEDRSKRIELVRSVNESFMTLVDTFLEDGKLEEKEYNKLNQFLENIRHKITLQDYSNYKNRIQNLYENYK